MTELQTQLDKFKTIYNHNRPHAALNRRTPQQAYEATIKAQPHKADIAATHRVRHDIVDETGTVTAKQTGEILGEYLIEPDKKYWKKMQNPHQTF